MYSKMIEPKIVEQILEQVEKYNKIVIYRHVFPDPDAYGAQVALKEVIKESFDEKEVYLVGKHDSKLGYIGEMDDEKTLEINKDWLGIVVDVGDLYRVDGEKINQCGYRIKIDHHQPSSQPFEDYGWVDFSYPATCMMILDLILGSKGILKTTKKAREALYIGIVADTGRFEYLDNPTDVFSKIINITYDIDTKPLYQVYYKQTMNRIQFTGYIYSHFETKKNGVAILKIPQAVTERFGLKPMEAARMVNALKNIEGITSWHFFAESEEGIMCEFRSSEMGVSEIARKYGGGGHQLAAGATVENWEVVNYIIQDLEKCANAE